MQLADITAVVSGGASGVGAATAAALVEAGAWVTVLDLKTPDKQLPGCRYLEVDVTDGAAVVEAVAAGAQEGPPLRAAVLCAGIAPSKRIVGRDGTPDVELFGRVIAVNLLGTYHVLAAAAQQIATTEPDEDGQRGAIVTTASGAAFEGQVGQAAYAASKGGVVGLTLPAARDLAQYGIRVNSIAPGLLDTPMVAAFPDHVRSSLARSVPNPARLGRPGEYAELALTLLRHDYMNGETVRMDGALRMAPG